MKKRKIIYPFIVLVWVLISANIFAGDVCKGYVPQATRDLDNRSGENKCKNSTFLKKSKLQEPKTNFGNDVKSGNTIEAHWVYTSCEAKLGKGFGLAFLTVVSIPICV